jgi:hypothetical protein
LPQTEYLFRPFIHAVNDGSQWSQRETSETDLERFMPCVGFILSDAFLEMEEGWMNTQRIQFLREILVGNVKGQPMSTIEFSYDEGYSRAPRFFGVPDDDLSAAQQLYQEWGGQRAEGSARGITVRRP